MTDESHPRVRVLWLIKGLGPGGAEQLLVSSAGVVDRRRFDYSVAYVRPDKRHLAAKLTSQGVPCRCLADGAGGGHVWPLRLRGLLSRFDVVHAHSPLLAGVVRLLVWTVPRSRRPSVVTTEHNVWQSFSTPTRWFNRLTTPMDAHRFAVSEEVKRSMSRGAAKGTEVLLHGIDHASFQAGGESRSTVRASLGISADTVVAITVANLRTEKDYPNLLHAAATACDREPRLLFLAVGQGPLESEVRALHTELGLAGRFVLMGFRDDVPDLLRAADLFVLGSAHEGLPVAIMEAMAAGLPVAATDVGGVAEAVVDDETGILVPPSDSEALATAILHVARDSGLRRRMSEAAVARSKLFDIRTAVDAQERVYDALLAP